MGNMRILQLRVKNTHKGNDRSNVWLSMKDPKTLVEDQLHYGLRDFSDHFHQDFFTHNNSIVKAAQQLGIDLGDRYTKFFDLGMRVSQQLDGRLREYTMAKYEASRKEVEEFLLNSALEIKGQILDLKYEAILYQIRKNSIPEEDIKMAEDIIKLLKERAIKRFASSHIDTIVQAIMKNEHEELEQHFQDVPDKLKSRFLVVATAHLLKQIPNWFNKELGELTKFLGEIGLENAKLYLDYIIISLQKEASDRDFYENNIGQVFKTVENLDKNQKNLFFIVLVRSQNESIGSFWSGNIAEQAVLLLVHYNREEVDRIIEEGFRTYQQNKKANELKQFLLDINEAKRAEDCRF